jgi:NADH-quinone oxidoreductase subunit D
MDYISGQRFHPDYTRVGGAMRDLPDEDTFRKMVRNFIDVRMPKTIKDLEVLLNRNRIFIDRLEGVGVLSKDDAIAWSVTGPLARSAGVKRDIRKDEPYLCFKDNWDGQGAEAVKFSVPIATTGDCLARYLVRVEEIKQSIKIIDQLIDRIPSGPMNVDVEAKVGLPSKGDVYGSIEATIQHFEIFMHNRGWDTPVGESYACIESPNGELGFYVVADGGRTPWRASTRPPSFIHFQLLPKLLEGHMIADLVAVLGSLNIIAAELDR